MRYILIFCAILIVAAGCTSDYSDLHQITVDFEWPETNAHDTSPKITLKNIPADTKQLVINMFDLDNRYDHGGGNVEYNDSSSIPEGALKEYQGPSPFYGAPRYEISVKAVAENGRVLAFGKKMKNFPPVPE